MKLRAPIFLLAIALIAVGGVALAAKDGSTKKVTLCAAKSGGSLSAPKNGRCGSGKRKLKVPVTGIRGKAGAKGNVGPPGAPGAEGTVPGLIASPFKPAGEAGPDCAASFVFCSDTDYYWINYGDGYAPVGYRTDTSGAVHLQGVAKAVSTSLFANLEVIHLPAGLRPPNNLTFPARSCEDGGWVRIFLNADGTVSSTATDCAVLDGITFQP